MLDENWAVGGRVGCRTPELDDEKQGVVYAY